MTIAPTLSASKIAEALLPLEHLPETVWLDGKANFNPSVPIKLHRATKVGFILRKPTLADVSVGTLVARKTLTRGKNTWRVMAFHQGKIKLRRADRRQPDFAMVSQAELAYTIGDQIPLYHPEGDFFGRHAVGRIRQPRWRGPVCHSSTGSLGCGDIGSHHRSGAVTKDCTLRSVE